MKRSTFIKSIFALTGTAYITGCRKIIDDNISPHTSIDLEESKKWFYHSYLATDKGARKANAAVKTLNWQEHIPVEDATSDLIWVPVEYAETDIKYSLLTWKEGEEYIPKLGKQLGWPILEGFIIYKNKKGDYEGFLVQLAYNPFQNDLNVPLDKSKFTGIILNTEWSEQPLRAWQFDQGKLTHSYNSDLQKGARTTECITLFHQYQTVTSGGYYHAVVTLHQTPYIYCWGSDQPSGPVAYVSAEGHPGAAGYSPYYSGSNGAMVPDNPSVYVDYNWANVCNDLNSWDHLHFKQRLADGLSATGLGFSTFDFTAAKAIAIVNNVGLNASEVSTIVAPLANTASKIGVIGAVVNLTNVYLCMSDGNITTNDILNTVGTLAGGATLLISATAFPLTVLALGTVSVGIAVYTYTNP